MACTTSGHTKASVLPEPVFATPTTSRPASASGSTAAWIGVGRAYPAREIASSSAGAKPACAKLASGAGGAPRGAPGGACTVTPRLAWSSTGAPPLAPPPPSVASAAPRAASATPVQKSRRKGS